MKPKCRRWSLV